VSSWGLLIREVDMGAAHSEDLRIRVVAEVAAGSSRRRAAARFKVSAASAVRWTSLLARTGGVRAGRPGRRGHSPLEPHAEWLKDLVAKEPDLTLAEIELRLLEGLGLKITERSIRRFFARHAISYKKNAARLRADAARRGRSARTVESRPSRS
jgi:transposase